MKHRTPFVSNVPLHPEISEKINNLHNFFKYKKKSILPQEHEFLPKGKFPSNLPFKKSRYSPNNLPDFFSGYKLNSDIDSLLYQSSSNKILNPWCLDALNSARVSNETRKIIAYNSWSSWFSDAVWDNLKKTSGKIEG